MSRITDQNISDYPRLLRPAAMKGLLQKLLRWSWMTGATSVMFVVGTMPALAEELASWNYDTATQSLNITLPATTTPNISVTADDQLLVELPNTQVGRAIGQTVFDGVVESIVLEQATPETVWMVVDFAPGTILASAQSATPLEPDTANGTGMRQWQVRPALMATRRVADAIATLPTDTPTDGNAAALRFEPSPSSVNAPIAQTADFPDLPILEPAIPIDAPISVPPITARTSAPAQPAPLPPVAINRRSPPAVPVRVPTITEADAIVDEPVIAVSAPDVPTIQPIVPPIVEAAEVEVEPIAVDIEPLAAEVEVTEVEVDVVAAPPDIPPVALSPALPREIEREPEIVIPEIDLSANESSQAPTSRWPEPIPFGQPLP